MKKANFAMPEEQACNPRAWENEAGRRTVRLTCLTKWVPSKLCNEPYLKNNSSITIMIVIIMMMMKKKKKNSLSSRLLLFVFFVYNNPESSLVLCHFSIWALFSVTSAIMKVAQCCLKGATLWDHWVFYNR